MNYYIHNIFSIHPTTNVFYFEDAIDTTDYSLHLQTLTHLKTLHDLEWEVVLNYILHAQAGTVSDQTPLAKHVTTTDPPCETSNKYPKSQE